MHPDDDRLAPPPPARPAPGTARPPARPPSGPAAHPRRRGPRPVPPGVEYHRVLAGDKRRVGRGILAIVLLVAGMFAFSIAIAFAFAAIDTRMGNTNPTLGGSDFTPLYHAGNLASIALLIPWSMVLQRWLYGVRAASLHSVVSRFRLDLFGRALLLIGPLWLLASVAMVVLMPPERTSWAFADLLALFTITLLLTPLQGAGEEYGFRGLVLRVAGSWGRGPRTGLVLGVVVSSLVFTVVHLSGDPWLNLWYFTIALTMALITWRTGGLEVAVVFHALNNTLTFLLYTVLHADQNAAMERSAGTGSIFLLLPCAILVVITAVVWAATRRGPALTPADPRPARS